MDREARYYAAIIGAGPAGLFAARQLADRNIHTVLFNRDIKPGGLAEYGIYPTKTRMKEGLRNQFRQILELPDIEYYGNVLVGERADLSLADLRALGFQVLVTTVGAQSKKQLGIPGEDLQGVYHAKDIVYHYNLLPPFSEGTYQIGKRVIVVGVGNVMLDVAHWLIEDRKVDVVLALARRGPAEVKFDRKELESVAGYVDMPALEAELARVTPAMQEVHQNPDDFRAIIRGAAEKGGPVARSSCFEMRFLGSPRRLLGDEAGQLTGVEVEENRLTLGEDGEIRARGTGVYQVIPADTVIFAIGDVVDGALGLPVQNGEYAKAPVPRFPVGGISYEGYDLQTGQIIPDLFFAGWARRPSTGLVGVARKDAINAVQAVLQYLLTLSPTEQPVSARLRERLAHLGHPVVDKKALTRLEAIEQRRARALGLYAYKFSSNQRMLEALGLVTLPQAPG